MLAQAISSTTLERIMSIRSPLPVCCCNPLNASSAGDKDHVLAGNLRRATVGRVRNMSLHPLAQARGKLCLKAAMFVPGLTLPRR